MTSISQNPAVETNLQSAYHLSRLAESVNIDADISEAMRIYLNTDLGIEDTIARTRAQLELERKIPKSVIRALTSRQIQIRGINVLDLGAGLGAMSEELILNGANVTSLEPGAAWAALAKRRCERHEGRFKLLSAFGENIPLPDNSVDLIVSLQVLEHVNDPERVLSEAWRVLRPGGHFYLACENYLAFWEAHYKVPWLPLMPIWLGKAYLKMLGRSTKFLEEAITYTTFPGVVGACRSLKFIRLRDEEILDSMKRKSGRKWQLLRLLSYIFGERTSIRIDDLMNTFKFGITEVFQKPNL